MKKIIYFCVCAIFITEITTVAAATIGFIAPRNVFLGSEDPVNNPDDKEFVLETMFIEEPGLEWLVRHLENDLGHKVNIYSEGTDVPATVIADNDVIYISEAISSGQVAGDYTTSTKPLMITEIYIADDMGLTGGQTTGYTGRAHGNEIQIVNPNHPITQGLPEKFVFTINDPNTGTPAIAMLGTWDPGIIQSGELLAQATSVEVENAGAVEPRTNVPILQAFEKGEAGNDARWLIFTLSDETPVDTLGGNIDLRTLTMLNENGVKLLDQAFAWLLGTEPADVDDWNLY